MSTMQITSTRQMSGVSLPRGELRLTRRGRLVTFLLALVVVLGIGLALAAGSVATPETGAVEPTTVVTVGTGDTLWDIASAAAEDGEAAG